MAHAGRDAERRSCPACLPAGRPAGRLLCAGLPGEQQAGNLAAVLSGMKTVSNLLRVRGRAAMRIAVPPPGVRTQASLACCHALPPMIACGAFLSWASRIVLCRLTTARPPAACVRVQIGQARCYQMPTLASLAAQARAVAAGMPVRGNTPPLPDFEPSAPAAAGMLLAPGMMLGVPAAGQGPNGFPGAAELHAPAGQPVVSLKPVDPRKKVRSRCVRAHAHRA